MSAKIEPKHLWLFNKIMIVDSREEAIAEAYTEEFPEQADELIKKAREGFPESIGYKTVHQLTKDIDVNVYLEQSIIDTESKEASLLKHFIDKFGEEAEKIALKESFEHGKRYGEDAVMQYALINSSPSGVYNILKHYLLDGWPPSLKITPVETTETSGLEMIEHHNKCMRIDNWKSVDAPVKILCNYTNEWIRGFCVKFNIDHERVTSIAYGDKRCEQTFTKKVDRSGTGGRITEKQADR